MLDPSSAKMIENANGVKDKVKKPADLIMALPDSSDSSLVKRIEVINSEVSYLELQFSMLEFNQEIPDKLAKDLEKIPLRGLFKVMIKDKKTVAKTDKFLSNVKNLVNNWLIQMIVQEMIMLLFGEIYHQLQVILKNLEKDFVEEN